MANIVRHARAIWWIKRDLRLADNAALSAALERSREVLPLFCEEPSLVAAPDYSAMHVSAWREGLQSLRERLRRLHADLYFSSAEVIGTLTALHARLPFQAIFAHEEIGIKPTYDRDLAVAAWCAERGIGYFEFPQSSVKRGGVNRDRYGELWRERIAGTTPLAPPRRFPMSAEVRTACERTPISAPKAGKLWQPVSETAAEETLASFLRDRGRHYSGGISSPNTAFHHGSRLSVHLAWGTITARLAWHAVQARLRNLDGDEQRSQWARSLQNFTSRLHWRDHFTQRMESEPELEKQALHPAYRDVPYEDDLNLLAAWVEGRTGFPMVDAVMRCLAATGFMNFRMRALAVSFACHALHLDWRTIHNPLAKVFRDFEPGIHFNQLQMQAGVVGWNAIRVYSPAKQFLEQDPRATFVKRWLPELRDHSADRIAAHADEPISGYPPPIVDFRMRTAEMKAILFELRRSADPAVTAAVYRKHGSRTKQATTRRPKKPPRADQPTLF